MKIGSGYGQAEKTASNSICKLVLLPVLLCSVFIFSPQGLMAQEQQKPVIESLDELAAVVVSLPTSGQMILALATPDLRGEALLDLAAAVNVLDYARQNADMDGARLAQKFLDDRGWLARLVTRYGWVRPHSAILDPAAWLVLEELGQHDLKAMALVHPDHTPQAVLVYQVFQRSGERLAVANLPILLLRIEAKVLPVWEAFLQLASPQGSPGAEWKPLETEWFSKRKILSESESGDRKPGESANLTIPQALSQLVLSTVDIRPPDSRRLENIRHRLFKEIPGLSGLEKAEHLDMLYLSSLIDGLHDGRYIEFTSGLLSIASGWLERASPATEALSLVHWLVSELPAISAHYAKAFAAVDPRLNRAMASIYKVLQDIANPSVQGGSVKDPRIVLADAVAQLTLLIPDMGYYFDAPVRARIAEEIDICTSIAASLDDDGYPTMTRRQFDGCMENLLQLAALETRMAELSGDIKGPFTTDSLRRELNVTSGQRINYGIGYLYKQYSSDCEPPLNALPNPLEWAVLATTMVWFAEHAPEFFTTPENESRLAKMRGIGRQLASNLAGQAECFAASGASINDLLSRSMADYETVLRQLDTGIAAAEADFRTQELASGADIALDLGASQRTSYRPDELIIEPCDQQTVCEMSAGLSTTRALIGLFPEEYLVAEQSGMGQIKICYRNMEWVERRSELVRPDDENVANYFGRLGFDLVGQYIENSQNTDIFDFRFTSPEEHHYLFAQASQEVLQDSCPMEWVGTRVITPLREDRGGIVPNRLTYLAASRTLPSRLLQGNWDKGAEWRDWFVTGIGVTPLKVPDTVDISPRLNQHLQSLYQAEQAEIYQRLLVPNMRNAEGDDVSLVEEMSQVSTAKALMRMQMMLFYPQSMLNSNSIRMAVAGNAGLLETRMLRRFREDDVALTSVYSIAQARLKKLRESWQAQPLTLRRRGSVPASLLHALTRVNIIYRQFFTSRPEPLEEIEVTAKLKNSQGE